MKVPSTIRPERERRDWLSDESSDCDGHTHSHRLSHEHTPRDALSLLKVLYRQILNLYQNNKNEKLQLKQLQ